MTEFKSHYTKQTEFAKEQLDKISPSFCLAKWLQVSLHLTNGKTHSCYHPPAHSIPKDGLEDNPSQLHNTPFKKQERQQMLNGQRPEGCEYCWKVEDGTGSQISDRYYRSGEPWAINHLEDVVDNPWDHDVTPKYVEVNFNQACNFSCSYCSPHLSSTWAKEIKQHGAYPTLQPHNDINALDEQGLMPIPFKDENPYVTAFWKWWPELYKGLKHFRMTGGEPLMDKNTYKVLDYIRKNPKKDLQLAITTNMCPDTRLEDKFFEQIDDIEKKQNVEHFMLFVSCDSIGKKAEYIRHGMDFHQLDQNVRRFLSFGDRRSITFINTFNNLSVTSILDWLKYVVELRNQYNTTKQKIWIDVPFLRYPAWQSIQILPEKYYCYLEEAIDWAKNHQETEKNFTKGIKDYEIQKLERALSWMKDGISMRNEGKVRSMANFYRFFSEHDRRRDVDFLNTFPEMNDFWNECKKSNQIFNDR